MYILTQSCLTAHAGPCASSSEKCHGSNRCRLHCGSEAAPSASAVASRTVCRQRSGSSTCSSLSRWFSFSSDATRSSNSMVFFSKYCVYRRAAAATPPRAGLQSTDRKRTSCKLKPVNTHGHRLCAHGVLRHRVPTATELDGFATTFYQTRTRPASRCNACSPVAAAAQRCRRLDERTGQLARRPMICSNAK
jgi:hypothetical protein